MKQKIIAFVFVALAACMWGFDGVMLTPQLYGLSVPHVVFFLHLIPALLMTIFFYKKLKLLKQMPAKNVLVFILLSLLGGVLGTVFIVKALFVVGFKHLTIVVLLQKLQPIFAIVLSIILLKEHAGYKYFLWAFVAIFSGYIMTFGIGLPLFSWTNDYLKASVYALAAAVSFGSATVLGKYSLKKYTYPETTYFRYVFTSIILGVYLLLFTDLNLVSSFTQNHWLFILIISLTTGSGAIFLYYKGLTKIKALTAVIAELFFPLSALVFGYFFKENRLTAIQWISMLLMLFAIIMAQFYARKRKLSLKL